MYLLFSVLIYSFANPIRILESFDYWKMFDAATQPAVYVIADMYTTTYIGYLNRLNTLKQTIGQ